MAIRTYRNSGERWYAIGISSANSDAEKHAYLSLIGFGWQVVIDIPNWIIPPVKVKHQFTDPATKEVRTYWTDDTREYSVTVFNDFFCLRYGRQSHDSSTEQSWCKTIPWLTWRFVRHSLYDLNHNHFAVVDDGKRKKGREAWRAQSNRQTELTEQVPKVVFLFKDFDGEELKATCYIEEREWRFGSGWFKWLSYFKKPIVRRELNITYSDEVGPKKNTYKGGIIGTSCEISKDELPVDAFICYCSTHNLVFLDTPLRHPLAK